MTPDQPISLAVAVFLSILCCVLPVRAAIVPLLISMCAYPTIVNVPPPQLQMTVSRVVALTLILRCIFSREIRAKFKWSLVDSAAMLYFGLLLWAQILTTELSAAINNRMGFFLSTLVPYFCVRMLVIDRPSFYIFIKGFLWTALPLSWLAMYQSKFGTSPFINIMQYAKIEYWKPIHGQWSEIRPFLGMNLFRASAPFMQCIMFGWFFAIQIPWATNLFWEKRKLFPWIIPWVFLPIGTVATVSAGPMMMAGMSFMITALFPWRRYGKQIFGTAALIYIAVSFFARRSVMELVASFGLDPASSFYRVNLLKFTMGQLVSFRNQAFNPMKDHWLAGYGLIPPAYDDYHDLCIQWICLVVQQGIMGAAGFYIFLLACANCMRKAWKRATSIADEWLVWSMLSILIGTVLAMQLVSLFGEMFFIYHIFLALVANTMVISGSGDEGRSVGVLAELEGQRVLLRYKLKPGQRLAVVRPAGNVVA